MTVNTNGDMRQTLTDDRAGHTITNTERLSAATETMQRHIETPRHKSMPLEDRYTPQLILDGQSKKNQTGLLDFNVIFRTQDVEFIF